MPIVRTEIASLTHKTVVNGTIDMPLTQDVALGDLIAVVAAFDAPLATVFVSDSQSNGAAGVLAPDFVENATSGSYVKETNVGVNFQHHVAIWYAVCSTAMSVSANDKIVLDFSFATNVPAKAFKAYKFVNTSLPRAWTFVKEAGQSGSTASTSPTCPDITTESNFTSDNNVVIAAIAFEAPFNSSNTLTQSAWLGVDQIATSGGTADTNIGLLTGWQSRAHSATIQLDGTLSSAARWMCAMSAVEQAPNGRCHVNSTASASAFRADAVSTSTASVDQPQHRAAGSVVVAATATHPQPPSVTVTSSAAGLAAANGLVEQVQLGSSAAVACLSTASVVGVGIRAESEILAVSAAETTPETRSNAFSDSASDLTVVAHLTAPALGAAQALGTTDDVKIEISGSFGAAVSGLATTEDTTLVFGQAAAVAVLSSTSQVVGQLQKTGSVVSNVLLSALPRVGVSAQTTAAANLSAIPTFHESGSVVAGAALDAASQTNLLVSAPGLAEGSVAATVAAAQLEVPATVAGQTQLNVSVALLASSAVVAAVGSGQATGNSFSPETEGLGGVEVIFSIFANGQIEGQLPPGRFVTQIENRVRKVSGRRRVSFGKC